MTSGSAGVQPHNYIPTVLGLLSQLPAGGADLHIEVLHDDWCGVFEDRACDCDPTVRLLPPIG